MAGILFLAHRLPWPPDRGDRIRSHHLLRALAGIGPVHVAAFVDDASELVHLKAVEDIAASVHAQPRTRGNLSAGLRSVIRGEPVSIAAFASPAMQRHVDTVIARHDIDAIVIFSSQVAQYVPAGFRGQVIVDFVDVDSAKFETFGREGHGPMRWVNAREGRLLAAFEAQVAARADAAIFVSEAEAALFERRSGATNVHAIGNGIDAAHFDPATVVPEPVDGPLIVFTGQMDYRPNVEAVQAFAATAMPVIRARYREARFAIVGRAPVAAVRALASDSVIVTGQVADTRPWLAAADVVVAPLGIARGVQNKVLEAMAMARPVVASAAAAEGIEACAGRHLLVGGTLPEQAALVVDLLGDPVRRGSLGRAARAHVAAHYGWDACLAPFAALLAGDGAPVGVAAE